MSIMIKHWWPAIIVVALFFLTDLLSIWRVVIRRMLQSLKRKILCKLLLLKSSVTITVAVTPPLDQWRPVRVVIHSAPQMLEIGQWRQMVIVTAHYVAEISVRLLWNSTLKRAKKDGPPNLGKNEQNRPLTCMYWKKD